MYDLLLKGDKSKDVNLESGDVLYFPPVGPQVAIVGSVDVPAIYELRGHESIAEALSLAGGVIRNCETSSLEIERTEKKPERGSARVAVDVADGQSSLAAPLRNADIVRVRAEAPRFEKTVTLRGNVATPGRFAWHDGHARPRPDSSKESLLTPDYWLRREQLGTAGCGFSADDAACEGGDTADPAGTDIVNRPATPQDAQTINSGLFPQLTAGVPKTTNAAGESGQFQSLAASSDRRPDRREQQAERRRRQARETLGTGPQLVTTPHFPIETQVVRMSPDIDWSYAVVERVDKRR